MAWNFQETWHEKSRVFVTRANLFDLIISKNIQISVKFLEFDKVAPNWRSSLVNYLIQVNGTVTFELPILTSWCLLGQNSSKGCKKYRIIYLSGCKWCWVRVSSIDVSWRGPFLIQVIICWIWVWQFWGRFNRVMTSSFSNAFQGISLRHHQGSVLRLLDSSTCSQR